MTRRIYPVVLVSLFLFTLAASSSLAGDDPSIQGELRKGIQVSMKEFVDKQTIGGVYRHYDPVAGKLLELEPGEIHSGIVKKGDFYVSCADFVDPEGHKLDLDFLVIESGGELRTMQAIVHKVDGEKRPYDLENEN